VCVCVWWLSWNNTFLSARKICPIFSIVQPIRNACCNAFITIFKVLARANDRRLDDKKICLTALSLSVASAPMLFEASFRYDSGPECKQTYF
jgi:hypothetical protein